MTMSPTSSITLESMGRASRSILSEAERNMQDEELGPDGCESNECEQRECHRCFPRKGCDDHAKCREFNKHFPQDCVEN